MDNKVDLSQQQIQQAAQAGVQLLNTPGAVNVPGPMAVSGIIQVLHAVLVGIGEQRLAVMELQRKPEQAADSAGAGSSEVADAVATAVKNNGKGEAPPIAPVESEKIPSAANEVGAAGEAEK